MPAGNLCVIHQPSGKVIATGQKTKKQCEASILTHMTDIAQKTEDAGPVTASYQVFTPYKGFGDQGVKAYSVERDDLVPTSPEPTAPATQDTPEVKTTTEVEDTSPQEVVL